MSVFHRTLARINPSPKDRRWVYVPYDQLSADMGPLAHEPAATLGIVLVESSWKAGQRPYHQQKLALVLANMRHFALEQAARGVAVLYLTTDTPYAAALRPELERLGNARVLEPAEHELRTDLAPLIADGLLTVLPHEGWLTSAAQFERLGSPPWRMDAFYRRVRRDTGILMEGGKPVGGKYSFDVENRKAWTGEPPAPEPPQMRPDEITREVATLVSSRFGHHPGEVRLGALPATRNDARRLWRWARRACLPHFGPYEDAMSLRSTGLFHTRIAALLNIHRLLPRDVLDDALATDASLPSKEGFVRQILGWREFVRHVHTATEGFRRFDGHAPAQDKHPGDGGWSAWSGRDWSAPTPRAAGGARAAYLGGRTAVPPAWWGATSGLACLDQVVTDVWRDGYGHHITRLMVLANLGTLLDISPRALTDWFWAAYTDAYDWVVEPNVMAMGTFGTGGLMTTKPYVSGAAYINRMSDYCASCRFDPRTTCPITQLYWAFLARKASKLEGNPRMAMPLRSLARRDEQRQAHDRLVYDRVKRALARGDELPADIARASRSGA